MLLLNYSQPLTAAQRDQLETLLGAPLEETRDLLTYLDHGRPFAEQATALADAAGLPAAAWQRAPLLVVLPAMAPAAAALPAELHGRTGHFPAVVRLRPVAGGAPAYEVAEVIDLQAILDMARAKRGETTE
jgi:hypothetical protein